MSTTEFHITIKSDSYKSWIIHGYEDIRSEYKKMIKAVILVTLCVAVLAHKEGMPRMPPSPQREANLVKEHHSRVARQLPSFQVPGGMSPDQIGEMMTRMASKGMDMVKSVMDPSKIAGSMGQMMPIPRT